MKKEIRVPKSGESVAEGDLAQWLKADGDMVEMDEPIAELETDKASLEIRAEADGRLIIEVEEGETVEVDQLIGYIETETDADAVSDAAESEADEPEAEAEEEDEKPEEEEPPEEEEEEPAASDDESERYEITVPKSGESVSEGDLARWFKQDGDMVEMDAPLAELETDKASLEITAETAGRLRIEVEEGETVEVGQVIGYIETGAPGEADEPEQAEEDNGDEEDTRKTDSVGGIKRADIKDYKEDRAKHLTVYNLKMPSPAARKLMAEHQLSAKDVDGTGKGGRITKADVLRTLQSLEKSRQIKTIREDKDKRTAIEKAIRNRDESASQKGLSAAMKAELRAETWDPRPSPDSGAVKTGPPPRPSENAGVKSGEQEKPAKSAKESARPQPVPGSRETHTEPMSRLRKTVARKLNEAQREAALLSTFNEVDMSAIMDLRKKYKEPFKKRYEVNLGFMSFFTRACCLALQEFPIVNAQIQDEEIVYHDYCDVGIAVSTPKGLVVPAIRNAEALDFQGIEKAIVDLATRARNGDLTLDDLSGGTFSITNGGIFGSMLSTPIVNYPQSAILGMHNIVERPVAVDGEVVIRPVMYVALSYDHRLIDGAQAVRFLYRIKEFLEAPERLMLQI